MIKFETDRLIFRRPTRDDFYLFETWLLDKDIMNFMGGVWTGDFKNTFQDFLYWHWETYGFGHFIVQSKETREDIGSISLKYLGKEVDPKVENPDIGGFSIRKFWNKGYATEAAKGLLSYAFDELGLVEVCALNYSENKASARVLEKLGFQKNGTVEVNYNGRNFGESLSWSISKVRFKNQFSI